MEQIDEDCEDDYVIFDCPGQIELYTHLPIMRQLVEQLERFNFRVCGVFLLDSQFLTDTPKYFSGLLAALSVMVTLEVPHVNLMTKVDLLSKQDKEKLERLQIQPLFFIILNSCFNIYILLAIWSLICYF